MKNVMLLLVFSVPCTVPASGQEVKPADEATRQPPAENKPEITEAEAARAETLFQSGRRLFFQTQYVAAIEQLEQAVAANPSKTTYALLLGKAHQFAGQEAKAIEVLAELLKHHADHVEAGISLAELLSPRKQPERVIAVLKPLLKYKHDYPLYHLLAEAYYQKEDFDLARTHFEEAIKLNPRSAGDHYQLGNIYLAQKRFAKAANVYETAGKLGQDNGAYHFKLASVYYNLRNFLGRVTEAEVIGGEVGRINNDLFLVDAVPGKVNTFYVCGPRSAIFQTARAQGLGVEIFDIHFLEANIWLSARRYQKAEQVYGRLQDQVRKEDEGLFWYSWSQSALGLRDYDEYLKRLDKAIAAQPDVYEAMLEDAYVTVANRYHQQGDSKRYLENLGKAVSLNPLSARLHLTLGDANWLAGESARAVEQYQLVLELEPDHPQRVRMLNRIRDRDSRD